MTRILVVDDNPENLYYLRTLLTRQGYEVVTAVDGSQGLEAAQKSPPDLIISDLLMPVMDGYALLRRVRADAQLAHVPFIVNTATFTEAEDERLASRLGADAFLIKPTEPVEFLARVAELLRRGPRNVRSISSTEDAAALLEAHSAVLIRKLEQKMIELEAANQSLRDAERDAAARAAVLDALFSSVPDLVMQVDLHGHVQLTNRAPGQDAIAPAVGTPFSSFARDDAQPILEHAFREALSSGKSRVIECRGASAASSTFYATSIAPIRRDESISGAVVLVRDVSERKRTEAQLIASDRMATLGLLAASVAHEINNPLASVTANLQLASRAVSAPPAKASLPPELVDALRDAEYAADRVRIITRDLKAFSRFGEEERGPVNVAELLDATLRLASHELRSRARVIRDYQKVPCVLANESRLGQVFLNLIINAAQAIAEGDAEHNEVRVTTEPDGPNRVAIRISDTGRGIPAAIRPQIFSPFVTTKAPGVGTGIGLSICHRLVTSISGTIDFRTDEGRGTEFRISLPVAAAVQPSEPKASAPEPARAPAAASAPAAGSRHGRVLVVDDERLLRQLVERALGRAHHVRSVASAEEALSVLDAGERFDVILCDLTLPGLSGLELFRRIEQLDAAQARKVIFTTGGSASAPEHGLGAVSNPWLEKPFDLEQLRALVKERIG